MIHFPSNLQKKPWCVSHFVPTTVRIHFRKGKHICRNQHDRLLDLKSGKSIIQRLGCRISFRGYGYQTGRGEGKQDGDLKQHNWWESQIGISWGTRPSHSLTKDWFFLGNEKTRSRWGICITSCQINWFVIFWTSRGETATFVIRLLSTVVTMIQ